MARKKKNWRDVDDPSDIFGAERPGESDTEFSDPAYDAFRRHIEENIQGETRAFHELRSSAEHELKAAIVSPPPRRPAAPQKTVAEVRPPQALAPMSALQPIGRSRGMSAGTVSLLSAIFTLIGFLLHGAWLQTPYASRKAVAISRANCTGEKSAPKKTASSKTAKLPISFSESTATADVVIPAPEAPASAPAPLPEPAAAAPVPAPTMEVNAPAEVVSKGLTIRAAELRKGPGSSFEIVDSLPPGFALEGSLTTDRQWLRVRPGAFVSVDALQFQEATAALIFQSFWVGPHVANIREFPLTSARVLRKADPGTELKLQIFNQEWGQLQGGGYVFRKLLQSEAPQALQLPALMKVVVDRAEIRGGPGQQYPVLGLYFRNHKVEVQELQSGWMRVGPDQFMRAQELEVAAKSTTDKTL